MNLSHVITEFSFGPHFPEITQPLDNSLEITHESKPPERQHPGPALMSHLPNAAFVSYQYFLRVVPTTYIPPRSSELSTNQYSVTHYTRELAHNHGTPGIFFKFEIEPMRLTIHQRTTTVSQFLIRCVPSDIPLLIPLILSAGGLVSLAASSSVPPALSASPRAL